MIAILINIAFVLLCREIVSSTFIDLEICDHPNEEFRCNYCETFCQEDRLAYCLGQNLTSDCFCKSGTVRDLKNKKCITIRHCSKKICDDNQTFNTAFGGEKICSSNGTESSYHLFFPITACQCNWGFIRDSYWKGECITTYECKCRKSNSTC